MKYGKNFLREKFLLQRKKQNINTRKFNFNLILKLINKNFGKKKVIIAAYYPANKEVNIINFLKKISKKKFKILLPVIKPSQAMCFKYWNFKDPLYVNSFGILEPKKTNKELTPDIVLVPLVAFDNNLNRIGYGKGYYDRKLARLKKNNKKIISIGLAYSFQKYQNIPTSKYDFKLHYIFTEQGIISSNQ